MRQSTFQWKSAASSGNQRLDSTVAAHLLIVICMEDAEVETGGRAAEDQARFHVAVGSDQDCEIAVVTFVPNQRPSALQWKQFAGKN